MSRSQSVADENLIKFMITPTTSNEVQQEKKRQRKETSEEDLLR